MLKSEKSSDKSNKQSNASSRSRTPQIPRSYQRNESETDHSDLSSSPRASKQSSPHHVPVGSRDQNTINDIVGLDEDQINDELVKWAGKLEMESIDLREKYQTLSLDLEKNTKALEAMKSDLKQTLQVLNYDQQRALTKVSAPLQSIEASLLSLRGTDPTNSTRENYPNPQPTRPKSNYGLGDIQDFGDLKQKIETLESTISNLADQIKDSLISKVVTTEPSNFTGFSSMQRKLEILIGKLENTLKTINRDSNFHSGIDGVMLNGTLNKIVSRMDSLGNSSNGIQYFLDDIKTMQKKLNSDFNKFSKEVRTNFYQFNRSEKSPPPIIRRPPTSDQIEELYDSSSDQEPWFVITRHGDKGRKRQKLKALDSVDEDSHEGGSNNILMSPETSMTTNSSCLAREGPIRKYKEHIDKSKLRESGIKALSYSKELPETKGPPKPEYIHKISLEYLESHPKRDVLQKVYRSEIAVESPVKVSFHTKQVTQGFIDLFNAGEVDFEDLTFVKSLKIETYNLLRTVGFVRMVNSEIHKNNSNHPETSIPKKTETKTSSITSLAIVKSRTTTKRMLIKDTDEEREVLRSSPRIRDPTIDYNIRTNMEGISDGEEVNSYNMNIEDI